MKFILYLKWESGYLGWYNGGLQAGELGFDSQQGQEIFLYFTVSRPALRPTQPPVQWVPGVGWLGHEAGHSSPSSDKVKNDVAIPPPLMS
jgi:hypothetical protein